MEDDFDEVEDLVMSDDFDEDNDYLLEQQELEDFAQDGTLKNLEPVGDEYWG